MKTQPMIYMAHPIKPIEGETFRSNVARAIEFYEALTRADVAV